MKIGKIFLYFIYLCATSLILMEIAVRIWGYSEHYIYDPIYQPSSECRNIPFVHKPCLKEARARGLALINTDALGLRSEEWCRKYDQKKPGELRIAITGDSVTFGEGVTDTADTFCVRLEDILEKRIGRPVTVFNFGVSAYSVREMAETALCRMPVVEPDIMIMAIIPEDFNLSRTGGVDRWGYTVHTDSSGIAAKDSGLKKILRSVHLTYLIRDIYQRLHNKESKKGPYTEENVPASYTYILKFRQAAVENHAEPLLVLLPSLGHRFPPALRKRLQVDNIRYLDLTDMVDQFSTKEYMASTFDPHPSAAVHRKIAETMADYLLKHLIRN